MGDVIVYPIVISADIQNQAIHLYARTMRQIIALAGFYQKTQLFPFTALLMFWMLFWPALALAQGVAQGVAQDLAQDKPKQQTLVVLGDSLTAGYGLAQQDGFVGQLRAALKSDYPHLTLINAGVSGDTSAGGLARFDWSVPPETDFLIVALGGNDLLRGLPPKALSQNLEAIITKAKTKNMAVLLAGMRAPDNYGAAYQQAFDAVYPALAEKHGLALMPFFLDGVAGDAQLNQPDGIHPNREGVAIMV
ncbi:MAG: arylesterase, partial [Parvibaculales bacterium]